MEDGARKLVEQVLVAVVLLWAATAHAQPENATGGMTVNGREFALRFVYASVQPGFFDKNTEDVRVLLTDVPIAEPLRGDVFALSRLARGGQLHGIEVVLDAKGEPMSGFLFLDAFDGMVSAAGMHRFERKALEAIQTSFDAFVATLTKSSAASFRSPGGVERFKEVRAETPPGSRVVPLANGADDTRVATVQAVRPDGIIIELFLNIRQEGTIWVG